jgi:hypothetical protein
LFNFNAEGMIFLKKINGKYNPECQRHDTIMSPLRGFGWFAIPNSIKISTLRVLINSTLDWHNFLIFYVV